LTGPGVPKTPDIQYVAPRSVSDAVIRGTE